MTERVFVASGRPGLSGFNNLGLGTVRRRIPAGWDGELVEVDLDGGDQVTAMGSNVYPSTNITMFRRRRSAPVLPFPGGSGSAA